MMALAAGLPTSFRDREDLRPEGETSLEMRQALAGPREAFARPDQGGLGAGSRLGDVLDVFVDRHDRAAVLVMAGYDAADSKTHRMSSPRHNVVRHHSPGDSTIAMGCERHRRPSLIRASAQHPKSRKAEAGR